jgi:hypothetical protein
VRQAMGVRSWAPSSLGTSGAARVAGSTSEHLYGSALTAHSGTLAQTSGLPPGGT